VDSGGVKEDDLRLAVVRMPVMLVRVVWGLGGRWRSFARRAFGNVDLRVGRSDEGYEARFVCGVHDFHMDLL
jgi:hypothetical protein